MMALTIRRTGRPSDRHRFRSLVSLRLPESYNACLLSQPRSGTSSNPMFASLPRLRSARFVIVMMLTLAMVCAHWQGLGHRIAHASQHVAVAGAPGNPASSPSDTKAATHSCLAYDAATVSPALHTPACTTAVLPAGRVLARWAAFASWNAPFTPYFSSRAPPRRLMS